VKGDYRYDPDAQIVEVRIKRGRKATQRGGSPPKSLARIMLRELVEEQLDSKTTWR
jgi:hypothetical protein